MGLLRQFGREVHRASIISASVQDFLDTIYDFDDFYDWTAVVWDEKELSAGFRGVILDNSPKLNDLPTSKQKLLRLFMLHDCFLECLDPNSSQ